MVIQIGTRINQPMHIRTIKSVDVGTMAAIMIMDRKIMVIIMEASMKITPTRPSMMTMRITSMIQKMMAKDILVSIEPATIAAMKAQMWTTKTNGSIISMVLV